MLIDAIVNKFTTYFEQDPAHDLVLWFDSSGAWRELLPHVRARLPRLITREGQLHIRYLLGQREPGERVVVYLRLAPAEALYLRPYFYTALRVHAGIETVLREAGVDLPMDRQLRTYLPKLALASVDKGRAFWQDIVNLETAFDRLFPDFDETLLRMLSQPQQTWTALQHQGLRGAFFDGVRLRFGVGIPDKDHLEDWADRFTARLCLVEAVAGLEEDALIGFPFADVLPSGEYRDRYRSLLHKWQHHELFKAAFKRRAKALDPHYNLQGWAERLSPPRTEMRAEENHPPSPSPGMANSFPNLARAQWEKMQRALDALASKTDALAFARDHQATFEQRAASFWAREGEVPGWQALAQMAQVILGAQEALKEIPTDTETAATAGAMIARYIETWWHIDRDYRHFLTQLNRATPGLDTARTWTARIYRDCIEALNDRFTALVMEEAQWPPAGQRPVSDLLWGTRATGPGRHALVMVDGLRYELAQDLATRLEIAPDQVGAAVSPVPSVTALGMAACLPGWPDFTTTYEEGDGWRITAGEDGDDNLARRDKRLVWLADRLRQRTNGGAVRTYNLTEWLSTPPHDLPQEVRWLVVTSQAIDAVGEEVGTVALYTLDALLDQLVQGVRRLKAADCVTIHIVSDHGFLLRETVRDAEKMQVREPALLKKSTRYAIGPRSLYAQTKEAWAALPHLPVSGSADQVAWFPQGIGCFATPGAYNYMHGGIALQEVVIPHIQIRRSVVERPVGVTLQLVGGPDLRNAIFKIRLVPEQGDLLSQPRRVAIDVIHEGQRVSRVWEAEVKHDVVEKTLMLEPAYGLAFGDHVQIRVRDATVGEILDIQDATVNVDLDL
jgi:hypothetical protein